MYRERYIVFVQNSMYEHSILWTFFNVQEQGDEQQSDTMVRKLFMKWLKFSSLIITYWSQIFRKPLDIKNSYCMLILLIHTRLLKTDHILVTSSAYYCISGPLEMPTFYLSLVNHRNASILSLPEDYWWCSLHCNTPIPPTQVSPSFCNVEQRSDNPAATESMDTLRSKSVVLT